jgi:hypothetical protein
MRLTCCTKSRCACSCGPLWHHLLLLREVVAGVVQQPLEDRLQRHPVDRLAAEQLVVQVVEQVHQRVVLVVDLAQAGDEVLVPDKGFHVGSVAH